MNVAETNRCVLVKVITKSVVPPALILVGANVFETVGGLAVTISVSVAVQIPPVQPAAVLVLVTPRGTEIDAVLVTCVCAKTAGYKFNRNTNANRARSSAPVTFTPSDEFSKRLRTFCLPVSKKCPVINDVFTLNDLNLNQ